MKDLVTKLSLNTIVVIFLCGLAMGQTETFQPVAPEKIAEILNTISTRVHQNFLQIDSWEGDAEVSRYEICKGEQARDIFEKQTAALGDPPDRIAKLTQSTTTFRSDLRKGMFYSKPSRKIPSVYMDPADGRDLGTKSVPWYTISILTPDYYIQSTPNRIRDGHVVQRRAVKEKVDKDCTSCQQPSVFDPRDLFDARSPVWLNYPHILERIRQKGEYVVDGHTLKVEQRIVPTGLEYRIHQPAKIGSDGENINIWLIKTFSSNAAYNMIHSEMTRVNGEPIRRHTFKYQLIEGIYVPSNTTEENFDFEDGSLIYQNTKVYKNIRLNHSIPEETFTYKNLGFENGDMLIDKINDKEHTYQDGNLVEVEKKSN
jgi:hypothetical protein